MYVGGLALPVRARSAIYRDILLHKRCSVVQGIGAAKVNAGKFSSICLVRYLLLMINSWNIWQFKNQYEISTAYSSSKMTQKTNTSSKHQLCRKKENSDQKSVWTRFASIVYIAQYLPGIPQFVAWIDKSVTWEQRGLIVLWLLFVGRYCYPNFLWIFDFHRSILTMVFLRFKRHL